MLKRPVVAYWFQRLAPCVLFLTAAGLFALRCARASIPTVHADAGSLRARCTFAGETLSEGGFKPNKVSSASLLESSEEKDRSGRPYYKFQLLTRSGGCLSVLFLTV
jgi:hypothetical protein